MVIAASFARIFRQNMFNCGMLAVELPEPALEDLFARFANGAASLDTDLAANRFIIHGSGQTREVPFTLAPFDRALVEAGGWLEYADRHY